MFDYPSKIGNSSKQINNNNYDQVASTESNLGKVKNNQRGSNVIMSNIVETNPKAENYDKKHNDLDVNNINNNSSSKQYINEFSSNKNNLLKDNELLLNLNYPIDGKPDIVRKKVSLPEALRASNMKLNLNFNQNNKLISNKVIENLRRKDESKSPIKIMDFSIKNKKKKNLYSLITQRRNTGNIENNNIKLKPKVLYNNQDSELINFLKTQPPKNRLKFSFSEFICLLISKKSNNKLLEKSHNIIVNKLDIMSYLQQVFEFNRMKIILFNYYQKISFKFMQRYDATCEEEFNALFGKADSFTEKSELVGYFIDAYLNNSFYGTVNEAILDSLDDDLKRYVIHRLKDIDPKFGIM